MSVNASSSRHTSMKTVAVGSFMGSMLEWYDFYLYGTAAALVFAKLFFPDFSALGGTLAAFATFGAGFFTRPLGGLIFGHYGDKLGRKSILVLTLLIMGVSTLLIGLLPTYDSVGYWAPAMLVALRLLQGLGLGGEYGGAALMVIEHAPKSKRGFWGSLPQIGSPAGLLLATGIFTLCSLLPEDQFMSWGWRLPFVLSALLLGVGLFIRLRVQETPEFEAVKSEGKESAMPLKDLVKHHSRSTGLAVVSRLADAAASNIFNAFALAYISQQLKLPDTIALTGVIIASAVQLGLLPLFGKLSDRWGRRQLYATGAAFTCLYAFPFFWLLNTGSTPLIWLAITIGFSLCTGLMFSVQPTFFAEIFRPEVRYTGLSVAYQISALLAGVTPFIATSLLEFGDGSPWGVSVYLFVIAALSFLSILRLATTKEDTLA